MNSRAFNTNSAVPVSVNSNLAIFKEMLDRMFIKYPKKNTNMLENSIVVRSLVNDRHKQYSTPGSFIKRIKLRRCGP